MRFASDAGHSAFAGVVHQASAVEGVVRPASVGAAEADWALVHPASDALPAFVDAAALGD